MGKCPAELKLPRKTLHSLIAARSGHGDFKEYHKKFGHIEYSLCPCGEEKSPVHFFFCRFKRQRVRKEVGKLKPHEAINWLLGTTDGAAAFSRIIK